MISIHRTLLLIPALLVGAGSALGATLQVPADHSSIQAGVLAAAPGDTVLVAPGTYSELIQMRPGIVLKSSDGPDSTILVSPGLGTGPLDEVLLECPEGIGADTIIEGFQMDAADLAGTAIDCPSSHPTIRGNVIRGFGWAVRCYDGASPLIEDNLIEDGRTFGVLAKASSPKIFRNTFRNNSPSAVTVSGKDSRPIIGGSRENSNRILGGSQAIRIDTRNDIDATWNDWGWEVMSEMDSKGYPADIITIFDGNNKDKTRGGRGKVDYRNWIRPEPEETADASGNSRKIWIPVVVALVLAIGFIVIVRR